jgi:hypothetical protein
VRDAETLESSSIGPGSGVGGTALPQTGNVNGKELALLFLNEGATAEIATNMLAIARGESG